MEQNFVGYFFPFWNTLWYVSSASDTCALSEVSLHMFSMKEMVNSWAFLWNQIDTLRMIYQQSQTATHKEWGSHEGLLGILTGELYASCLVFSQKLALILLLVLI